MTELSQSSIPFWRSGRMHGESLFLIEPAPGEPARSSLLLTPLGSVRLESATGEIEYVEDVDYTVDRTSGMVTCQPGSRMPTATIAELYPSRDPDGSGFMHVRDDPSTFLLVGADDLFHRRQVRASYAFDLAEWTGYAPRFAGASVPSTLARLRRGAPLTISVLGDSISAGYNASAVIGAPPYLPAFPLLVAAGLERAYGATVTLHNLAVPGWTSDDGLGAIGDVGPTAPHLVLIAFGMNDAGYADPPDYAANIRGMIDGIRHSAPGAELILVSPMLPNPSWHYPQMDRIAGYRQELLGLCQPGIIVADMTQLWTDLLTRKSTYDLTGNGLNHPNDWGQQLYAQVILSLLT